MAKKENRTIGFTEAPGYICLEDLQQVGNVSMMSPIALDYCGSEQCKPGYAFGPFVRTCYVMHFVIKGKGILRKEGKKIKIEAGQAFLIYPNEETVYQADFEEPWKYMWIGFHGFSAEEMMEACGLSRENPIISVRDLARLEKTMNEMLAARDLNFSNEMQRMSSLYSILAQLGENRTRMELEKENKKLENMESMYVRTAVNLIMNSYKSIVKISQIADTIGISRGYLTTIFKREMHTSPQDFLIRYRMEKASALLTNTNFPVSVVASEVGYADAFAFSKVFKLKYGMSPIDYRNQKKTVVKKDTKGNYVSETPL